MEWVQASRMPDRAKKAMLAASLAHTEQLRASAVLSAISPGRWSLSQGGKAITLDFTSGRQTQLEAATRFAARMLMSDGMQLKYIGAEWTGQDLPDEIFARPVGANALRNARSRLADHLERIGWPEVGAEIRRMTVGRNGELDGFEPSGRVLVAHPCAVGVQGFP